MAPPASARVLPLNGAVSSRCAKLRLAANATMAAQRMQPKSPQRGAMPAGPINASYATAAALGTPDDANWIERLRDRTLGFFVMHAIFFDSLAALALLGLVCFGGLIAVAIFPAIFGVPLGDWSVLYPECEEAYLQSLGNITQPATPIAPPRYRPFKSTHDRWAAPYCTTAQLVFMTCIKAFVFIFSYINFLPIPWRLSIWMEAFVGRPMMDDVLHEGVDFYGRPTEALWFHLPRTARRRITILLNLAWIAHFASQTAHLVYWSHADGQSREGTLAQNVPFAVSVIAGVVAGNIQGREEKRLRAAQPTRFPPDTIAFVRSATAGAQQRWRDERAERPSAAARRRSVAVRGCCFKWCSPRFWQLLLQEVRTDESSGSGRAGVGLTRKLSGVAAGPSANPIANPMAGPTGGVAKRTTKQSWPTRRRRPSWRLRIRRFFGAVAREAAADAVGIDAASITRNVIVNH